MKAREAWERGRDGEEHGSLESRGRRFLHRDSLQRNRRLRDRLWLRHQLRIRASPHIAQGLDARTHGDAEAARSDREHGHDRVPHAHEVVVAHVIGFPGF